MNADDALNRPTLLDAPTGTNDTSFTYDLLGRTRTTVAGGQTLTNAWDALGRQISEAGPLGTVAYQYDLAGRRTRITWPGSPAFYAQYDYDLSGALTAVRENGATSGSGVLATYAYDNLGRRTGATLGNGGVSSWTYDGANRVNGLTHDLQGTANDLTLGFTYNPANQIVSRTLSNPSVYAYTPGTGTTAYVNNGRNQVTSVGGSTVSYNARQNITAFPTGTYGYNANNELTSATVGGTTTSLSYDPGGRLYQSGTTRFLYDGQQVIGEYDASGGLLRRYVPGLGLDNIATAYEGAGFDWRWLLSGERQSVVSITDGSAERFEGRQPTASE